MSKISKYIVLIGVLIAANLWLFFGDSSSKSSEPVQYFAEVDLENVTQFQFDLGSVNVLLEREGEDWLLNDTYRADQGFINSLLGILDRVEAGRTIENWDQEVLGEVKISSKSGTEYQFDIATNSTGTKSYFVSEGIATEVAVPGYRDNVIDLFTLHPDQWRDRLVFDGNWRTIQQLDVEFSDPSSSFNIKFDDKFFLVDGETPNDSTEVIDFLNQFEYFQANEMISDGRFSNFDSLKSTRPLAVLTIDDIKLENPIKFKIFPSIARQPFHLVVKNEEELMVVDANRVGAMLRKPE